MYIHFKRLTLGGRESHPYLLHQTLARSYKQEVVEPNLALKDIATGAEGFWLVSPQRHSEGPTLLGHLDPAPGMEHCAAQNYCYMVCSFLKIPKCGCAGRAPLCKRSLSLTFPTQSEQDFMQQE